MWIRRQISTATVKALHTRLQQAYQHDDVRLVRRTMVLRNVLVYHVPVEVLCAQWGLSPACIYGWRQAFLLRGMDSVVYRHGGGRRPKLTAKQKKRLVELPEAGPLAVGCETGCWTSVLIRVLIWREFGVLSNGQYVCTLLHNLGFSLQKARVVSDHLDTATRLAWLAEQWSAIFRAATRCHGLILFDDEASCAPVGLVELPMGAARATARGQNQWQAERLQGVWCQGVFVAACKRYDAGLQTRAWLGSQSLRRSNAAGPQSLPTGSQ